MADINLKSLNRVLTHMGYAVKKDSLTPEQIDNLRTELTVAPKVQFQNKFAKAPEPFTIFQESPSRFYCPRMWAIEKFGHAIQNTNGKRVPVKMIAEQHIMEDCCGKIPTVADWLMVLAGHPADWMLKVGKIHTQKLETV